MGKVGINDSVVNGRLTQIGQGFREHKAGRKHAVFRCECGKKHIVQITRVRSGRTKSCGCLAREMTVQRSCTHGQAATSHQSNTYRSWSSMKCRCLNQKSEQWQWYGGRGIRICERWVNSFEAFFEDMGERPSHATLDRIDSDGNYEPGNCRWATDHQQSRNHRRNRILTAFGKAMCVTDWAIETGIWKTTIKERLNRGWTVEQALTMPVRNKKERR